MKVLVIGGTLFIGRPLVAELLKAGHDVTVLHRKPRARSGPARAEHSVADRNDPQAHDGRALAGKNFEVVFDNVYDWERGTTAAQVEAAARAWRQPPAALRLHVERGGLRRRPESPRRRRAGAGRPPGRCTSATRR